jgi:hypothetical protein
METEEIQQEQEQQDPSVNLSTDIFKYGTLINVGIGFWEGKVLQTQKDQEVLGNTIDYEIFAPGYKWLVPSKYTRVFSSYRSRLNSYFDKMSYRVPGMRGARFVPRKAYPWLKNVLETEKTSFFRDAEDFLGKYEEISKQQIDKFNERFPEHTGYLNSMYPSVSTLRSKFNYSWTLYSWAHAEISEVAQDAKNHLSERAEQLVHQSTIQIREHILSATSLVLEAIKNGKNNVNIRSINAFKERIEQLKQINLFNDPEIDKMIKNASNSLNCISSWKKEDVDKTDIEINLTRVIESVKKDVKDFEENSEKFAVVKRRISNISASEVEQDVIVTQPNITIKRRMLKLE